MALQMNDATYGRNLTGRAALVANLQGDIDKAIAALDGAEYNTVVTTVKNNWNGADADEFLAKLKATKDDIKKSYKQYKSVVQSALNSDSTQFTKMQNANKATIANTIK